MSHRNPRDRDDNDNDYDSGDDDSHTLTPDAVVELPPGISRVVEMAGKFDATVEFILEPTPCSDGDDEDDEDNEDGDGDPGISVVVMCRLGISLFDWSLSWRHLRAMRYTAVVRRPCRFAVNVPMFLKVISNASDDRNSALVIEIADDNDHAIMIKGVNSSGHSWFFDFAKLNYEGERPMIPPTTWSRTAVPTKDLLSVTQTLRTFSDNPSGSAVFLHLDNGEGVGIGGRTGDGAARRDRLVVRTVSAVVQGGFTGDSFNGPVEHGVAEVDADRDVSVCLASAPTAVAATAAVAGSDTTTDECGSDDDDDVDGRARRVMDELLAFCTPRQDATASARTSRAVVMTDARRAHAALFGIAPTTTNSTTATAADDDEDWDPTLRCYAPHSYAGMFMCQILQSAARISDRSILHWADERPLMIRFVDTACRLGPTTRYGTVKVYFAPRINDGDDD